MRYPIGKKLLKEFKDADIRISLTDTAIVIENSCLRRVLDIRTAMPVTTSFVEKRSGREHASAKEDPDFSFMGFSTPGDKNRYTEYALEGGYAGRVAASIFHPRHVRLQLRIAEKVQKLVYIREYFIYRNLPVMSCRTSIASETKPNIYWTRRGDLHLNGRADPGFLESIVDSIRLSERPARLKAIEFHCRTDYDNKMLEERVFAPPPEEVRTNGNLLFAEGGSGDGIFFLQEAPPTGERRDFEEYDFRIEGTSIRSVCWGIRPEEVATTFLTGYTTATGLYSAGESEKLLKEYLALRFPQNPERDYSVTVNPWGCGKFPEYVSTSFLAEEIRAAGEIGATHYQIDDGWQQGRKLAELSWNNRSAGEEFWEISPELLPDGFRPLLDEAKKAGIELALWFAPSFNKDYADWKTFIDIFMRFHNDYGINMFKIDAVQLRTKAAEDNLEKMVRTLRKRSKGKIYFNFDVTNGQRAGFFRLLEYGNIFLENRYVFALWGVPYHPETTLNNIWRLSRYVRLQTIQVEFTDPGIINREGYRGRGMTAPDEYPPEYWAAIALFANPLIWLAPSRLDKSVLAAYRTVIDLHKKYRREIFDGVIYPVGAEPDGKSLTGFQSHGSSGDGYLVVYRERLAPARGVLALRFMDGDRYTLTNLVDGTEQVLHDVHGGVEIEIDKAGGFKLFKYKKM